MKKLLSALADHLPPTSVAPASLRERLLSTVAQPRWRFAPLYRSLSELFDLDERQLTALFERAAPPAAWTPSPIPGTFLLHLEGGPRVAGADNGLVRVQAGARFPQHRHLGNERVLLLDGSYRDEPSGRLYRAGDLHEMPEGSTHAYVASPERELWLAVSVVQGVDVDGFGPLSPSSA
jgi:quercetin dioxygenase-like cupin family protein